MTTGESLADAADLKSLSATERFLRRRNFFIHRRLQLRLLGKSLLHTLLIATVMGVALFGPLFLTLQRDPTPTEAALRAADLVLFLHTRFWPALALAFLLVTLDSIRTSHRIAGPLFRFERTLQDVRDGKDAPPITLRKGDFLEAEAELINVALEENRGRERRIRDCHHELLDATDRFLEAGAVDDRTREELCRELVEKSTQLANSAIRDAS